MSRTPPPLILICPHCNGTVEIVALNCRIFRHGIFKRNGQQIPPHASKLDCDRWVERSEIWGCGKPFKIEDNVAVVCDYI
jgi:hypothetical protein